MVTPLRIALENGEYDAASFLLEQGADVEHRLKGNTILQTVINDFEGQYAIRFLLSHGANANAINDEGLSVLDIAIRGATRYQYSNNSKLTTLLESGKVNHNDIVKRRKEAFACGDSIVGMMLTSWPIFR
jgi:ankyrin repeat protein